MKAQCLAPNVARLAGLRPHTPIDGYLACLADIH